ncbi:unnamed protein product [Trichogramma brassicae]|uniref:Uncharacterized protein n=1 Tax=Trichogramma brassicae TaxID=86971 RepID=A0A6H5IR74_9HYME|nr:unnamed protein product [Trichogramma brassicae]
MCVIWSPPVWAGFGSLFSLPRCRADRTKREPSQASHRCSVRCPHVLQPLGLVQSSRHHVVIKIRPEGLVVPSLQVPRQIIPQSGGMHKERALQATSVATKPQLVQTKTIRSPGIRACALECGDNLAGVNVCKIQALLRGHPDSRTKRRRRNMTTTTHEALIQRVHVHRQHKGVLSARTHAETAENPPGLSRSASGELSTIVGRLRVPSSDTQMVS